MTGGLTDGPPHVYSAVQMAHEWYAAGRPFELRSAQETRTNYDCQTIIDFDYLTCYLIRVQSEGAVLGNGDWISYFAIFRSPGDKLEVEWHPGAGVPFAKHTNEAAYDVIRWFTGWAEDRMENYPT